MQPPKLAWGLFNSIRDFFQTLLNQLVAILSTRRLGVTISGRWIPTILSFDCSIAALQHKLLPVADSLTCTLDLDEPMPLQLKLMNSIIFQVTLQEGVSASQFKIYVSIQHSVLNYRLMCENHFMIYRVTRRPDPDNYRDFFRDSYSKGKGHIKESST